MKRIIVSVVLIVALIFTAVSPAFAAEAAPTIVQAEDGSKIIYYDDGSTVTISPARIVESQTSTYSITKSHAKEVTYTGVGGNVEWTYTLTATFRYVPGAYAVCDEASYSVKINDNDWTFSNGSATYSGNVAYGKGTFVKKVLGITVKTVDIDISLTCDKNGNIT